MSIAYLKETINYLVLRLQFSASVRVEFYETLSLLLENRVLLNDALKEINKIASADGKHPTCPQALISNACMQGVAEGQPLSLALKKWTNGQEIALLAAGEKSGNLQQAFDDLLKLINAKQQIRAAILSVALYPAVLLSLICVLLNNVATQLVPKLVKMTDPHTWQGAAALLYQMAQFVSNYGKLTLTLLFIFLLAIFSTLPYLRSALRILLDRIPPWSIYRMLHGATFLLSLANLLRARIKLQEALLMLAEHANPWLKERIEAALYGARIGANFGEALHRTGYAFPDQKAIQYLMILANQDGFEGALSRFGERWLQQSIQRIQAIAKAALAGGLLVIGVLMLIVIAGANGIQDAVQAGLH